MSQILELSDAPITLEQLDDIAHQRVKLRLSDDPRWRAKIKKSREVLEKSVQEGRSIYGVNTGFGRTSRRQFSDANRALQVNLIRMHGCGVGPLLDPVEARAIMMSRLTCLAKGYSGVRLELLEHLVNLINSGITPAIPSFGSVGASGDLTPLSYLGALVIGERDAFLNGELKPASEALKEVGLTPFTLETREGLALINGTSMMNALSSLLIIRIYRLLDLSERAAALALELVNGRPQAMHPVLHKVKPHQGQQTTAAHIYAHLQGSQLTTTEEKAIQGLEVQDRYSIRCTPQLLGAARDAIDWAARNVLNELNSVNDNPVVDPETETIYNGGHFYGGHIGLSMDLVKVALGSIINLFDRQFALLIGDATPSLPETLLPNEWLPEAERNLHHGMKALQITLTSLTALAQQRAFPDTLMSKQTECDNQDVVSMGTNATLNARAILEFCEQGLAAWLGALSQSAAIRGDEKLSPASQKLVQDIRQFFPIVEKDRPLDHSIQQLLLHFIRA